MKKFKKLLRTALLSTTIAVSGLGFFSTNAHAEWFEWGDIFFSYDWNWRESTLRRRNGSENAVMYAGQYMHAFRALDGYNPNNGVDQFILRMQEDGNLVLYRAHSFDGVSVLWASHTMGSGAHRLEMQADGNLVLYRPDNRPVWASHTQSTPSKNTNNILTLQTDGNLVLYRNTTHYENQGPSFSKSVPWATGTNQY